MLLLLLLLLMLLQGLRWRWRRRSEHEDGGRRGGNDGRLREGRPHVLLQCFHLISSCCCWCWRPYPSLPSSSFLALLLPRFLVFVRQGCGGVTRFARGLGEKAEGWGGRRLRAIKHMSGEDGRWQGRGGVLICCLPYCSRSTIYHASLSRRSTVPTPNRDTPNSWAFIYVVFHLLHTLD